MSPQAWITLAVLVVLVVVLAREIVPPAIGVLAASILLLLIGVIDSDQAFAGFSNEAPIVVGALLVLAKAADLAGLFQPAVEWSFGRNGAGQNGNGRGWILPRIVFPLAGMSAFLNNTTLVAMTVPSVLETCRRRNLPPSDFLMPISYAAVLGGVITTIGTSTNLTVSGLLDEAGMPPLALFELTPVGLPLALAGCIIVLVLAPRLLPKRQSAAEAATEEVGREFTVSMRVVPDGAVSGRTVEEAGLRHLSGVFLVEIARTDHVLAPVAPTEVLEGGDVLTFVGRVDDVVDLHRIRGLESTASRQVSQLDDVHAFYEAVVGSNLAGRTLREADFRARYGGAVLAIHRAGQRLDAKLGDVRLRVGDTLLLVADPGFRERFRDGRDFILIAGLRGVSPFRPRRAWLVAAIGIGFIVATGTGLVPILHGSLAAAILVVGTRVLTIRQARDAVDLNILVLIAASFGLGAAVQSSGLGQVIANLLVSVMSPFGVLGALAAVLIGTMALTELMSNNAAAVLIFPIAIATAAVTGTDPRPYVIAVTMGASLSFLTPIGYQTNLMVYGPGGYRFADFTRLGAPIDLAVVILGLILIPIFFPL